jgi:hypothetical protein
MTLMKKLLSHLAAAFVLCSASHAAPPTVLTGLVYRDGTAITSIRSWEQQSLRFPSSSTFESQLRWRGSLIAKNFSEYADPISGTYTYEQISPREFRLLTTDAKRGATEFILTFETDSSGTVKGPQNSIGEFSLRAQPDDAHRSLANVSTRVVAQPGVPIVVGFVITGKEPRDVLIRIVGPGLELFGIKDPWKTPSFRLPNHHDAGSVGNDVFTLRTKSWSATDAARETNQRAFARTGAFPLEVGSGDLSDVVRVRPGVQSVVITPEAADPGGTVLIEVYEL